MLYSRRLAIAAALGAALLLPLGAQSASPLATEPVSLRHAPATVDGLWCGAGLLTGFTLDIAQQYQRIEARLIRKGRVREITGHMDGPLLRTDPQRDHTMELLAAGNELRIIDGTGALAMTKGQFFTRAAGASCTN
jgi:hypothetical protein